MALHVWSVSDAMEFSIFLHLFSFLSSMPEYTSVAEILFTLHLLFFRYLKFTKILLDDHDCFYEMTALGNLCCLSLPLVFFAVPFLNQENAIDFLPSDKEGMFFFLCLCLYVFSSLMIYCHNTDG